MYANVNLLLRKLSKFSVNVKCYLFKSYCSNLYCALMWFGCTKTALLKLIVAHNNNLGRFNCLPRHNIKSFGELLRVFEHGFCSRIIISRKFMHSSNCNSPCSNYSELWTWWRTLLYVHL